jgi:hypothetical protein
VLKYKSGLYKICPARTVPVYPKPYKKYFISCGFAVVATERIKNKKKG